MLLVKIGCTTCNSIKRSSWYGTFAFLICPFLIETYNGMCDVNMSRYFCITFTDLLQTSKLIIRNVDLGGLHNVNDDLLCCSRVMGLYPMTYNLLYVCSTNFYFDMSNIVQTSSYYS